MPDETPTIRRVLRPVTPPDATEMSVAVEAPAKTLTTRDADEE